jgi:hypothetical protein
MNQHNGIVWAVGQNREPWIEHPKTKLPSMSPIAGPRNNGLPRDSYDCARIIPHVSFSVGMPDACTNASNPVS